LIMLKVFAASIGNICYNLLNLSWLLVAFYILGPMETEGVSDTLMHLLIPIGMFVALVVLIHLWSWAFGLEVFATDSYFVAFTIGSNTAPENTNPTAKNYDYKPSMKIPKSIRNRDFSDAREALLATDQRGVTEIKVPAFPESVQEGILAKWYQKVGNSVSRDELIVDIETDWVVIEIVAPVSGVLSEIFKLEGDSIVSNEVIARIQVSDAEETAKRKADVEARRKADAEEEVKIKAEIEAKWKADAEEEVNRQRDLQKQRQQDERDESRVTNTIALMQRSLPFYRSVTEEEGSESHAGNLRWKGVLQAIKATDDSVATLYFVKLLSLLDNKEYYKIGMTAKSVEERFETSTQIELLEVVATFTAARYLVLFAEYHFIREFEITDELSKLPDMSGPDVKFSGSSEVVRANARGKISGFFEKLKGYEDKVVKGVVEFV
jgi:biotin carboxyl carrier protein